QPPKCATDATQGQPRSGYEEGNQGRIAFLLVTQCAGQAVANGSKQSNAGDSCHQFFRQCGKKTGHGRSEQAGYQIEKTGPDRSEIAAMRISICFRTHADCGGNGSQIELIAAE